MHASTISKELMLSLSDDENDDVLLQVEQEIARRADQISGGAHGDHAQDVSCWIRAENEVLTAG